MALRVLVCPERNPRAARIVAGILRAEADLDVSVGNGGNGHGVPADVVVLTAGLPDMRDLAELRKALGRYRFAPLVVLSLYDDPRMTNQLLSQGVSALLPLDQVLHRLPRMIRRLAAPPAAPRGTGAPRPHVAP
ncbi:MAG: hypothetical protein KKI08_19640 [Armatimonadetes bacterium]|nr:hypothetical protein [Armatimonadota bacterium]